MMHKMIDGLPMPAKTFFYLSAISLVLYVFQSAAFMGMGAGMIRTLVSKIVYILLWTYLLSLVCKHGGGSGAAAAFILALAPFMPAGFSLYI